MIFSNIRTEFNFIFWSILCGQKANFKCGSYQIDRPFVLWKIMTRYDFQEVRGVILSNVRTDSNLTGFHFWSTFHMNCNK